MSQGFMLDATANVARFSVGNDALAQTTQTHGNRWHFKPTLSYPIEQPGWFITPAAKVDMTYYALSLGTTDTANNKPKKPNRVVPIFETSAGLWLEKQMRMKDFSFFHTLEPQLYYLYVPYVDQDPYPNFDSGPVDFGIDRLWRDNRFSSFDRVGDTHQVSLGLTSRVIDEANHFEKVRASIGQLFYLKERRVTTCDQSTNPACRLLEDPTANDAVSPLIMQLGLYPSYDWYTLGTWEYNYQIGETDRATVGLEYRGNQNATFNIGTQYLRVDPSRTDQTNNNQFSLNQISTSFFYPLSNKWNVMGRLYYDRAEHHLIDSLAGFEYESCCFALQFVAQRYLKGGSGAILRPRSETGIDPYDNVFSLQISLKGLSTFGVHDKDKSLKKLIPGYKPFDARLRSH